MFTNTRLFYQKYTCISAKEEQEELNVRIRKVKEECKEDKETEKKLFPIFISIRLHNIKLTLKKSPQGNDT